MTGVYIDYNILIQKRCLIELVNYLEDIEYIPNINEVIINNRI